MIMIQVPSTEPHVGFHGMSEKLDPHLAMCLCYLSKCSNFIAGHNCGDGDSTRVFTHTQHFI